MAQVELKSGRVQGSKALLAGAWAVGQHVEGRGSSRGGGGGGGGGLGAFWVPFTLLLARTWREQTRDTDTLTIKYIMNTFFCLLFGIVYLRMVGSAQHARGSQLFAFRNEYVKHFLWNTLGVLVGFSDKNDSV